MLKCLFIGIDALIEPTMENQNSNIFLGDYKRRIRINNEPDMGVWDIWGA